jgi:hypothetical protein
MHAMLSVVIVSCQDGLVAAMKQAFCLPLMGYRQVLFQSRTSWTTTEGNPMPPASLSALQVLTLHACVRCRLVSYCYVANDSLKTSACSTPAGQVKAIHGLRSSLLSS